MARWGVHRPKRLSERYELLAGELDERRTRYLLRRHLGIEPEDVPALPWWKRRFYVEGLLWEFANEQENEQVDGTLDNLEGQGFAVGSIGAS